MKPLFALLAFSWVGLWYSPDQQGRRLFRSGDYAEAARTFTDPMWQGTAWYRAGEFKRAGEAFARRDNPEANYNRGNALLMQGKYQNAVELYEKALEENPGWKEAQENRDLAAARAKLMESKGGDMGDQEIGADEIVFDEGAENQDGKETTVDADQAVGEEAMQELWLRRVTTRPADFLKAKFAYQAQFGDEGGREEE